jgi:hypothetical protein
MTTVKIAGREYCLTLEDNVYVLFESTADGPEVIGRIRDWQNWTVEDGRSGGVEIMEEMARRLQPTRRWVDEDGRAFIVRSCRVCGKDNPTPDTPPHTRLQDICNCGAPVEIDLHALAKR